ncbi:hypothetical protein [Primorskyibacter aestuariivivens]
MSDHFWLTDQQMATLAPLSAKSHSEHQVDGRMCRMNVFSDRRKIDRSAH